LVFPEEQVFLLFLFNQAPAYKRDAGFSGGIPFTSSFPIRSNSMLPAGILPAVLLFLFLNSSNNSNHHTDKKGNLYH